MATKPFPKNMKQAEKEFEGSKVDKKMDKEGAKKLLKKGKK